MMFNNWIFALQAYQMGAGGVMQSVKETHSGATHMEITSKTYWYVKKYLAHKVAYENAVQGKGQITSETAVSPNLIAAAPSAMQSAARSPVAVPAMSASGAVRVNGIATIIAAQGDTPTKLATRAGADLSAFLKWNDLSISDAVQPGQRFLLGKKRARSTEAYHKVRTGETLWSVSQVYGVQMKKLRKYNRMSSADEALVPGTTLWLSSMRPRDSNKAVKTTDVVQIDQQETFAWETAPTPVAVVTPPPVQNMPVIPQNAAQDTVKSTPVIPTPEPVAVVDTATNVKTSDVSASTQDSVQTLQVTPPPVTVARDSVATIIVEPPPAKKDTHIVQVKETLYGIAKQYNVAVMDLVRWNNLDLQQGIRPGQVIKLTDPQPVTTQPVASAQPTQIVHEVKASDTLYSVARKYGVTIKELMDWNGKKDFSLSTGEKLKVFQK
jgi:membrane-bound lytic murein transglycosylase D